MSDDAISRQAAIDAILTKYTEYERLKMLHFTPNIIKQECADLLTDLPYVTPKQRWIPVSERLPETNDDVLVCDGIDMFVAWYSWEGLWQGWNSSDYNFERDTPIIAWIPLPKPYDPQESEEHA